MSVEERQPLLRDGPNESGHNQPTSLLSRIHIGKLIPLEKSLIVVAAAFFVSSSVLTGLYIRHLHKDRLSVPAPLLSDSETDIDTTLNPCDDFYEFTCNNWERNHVLPDGSSETSVFHVLTGRNKEAVRKILSGTFEDFYGRTHLSSSSSDDDAEKATDKKLFQKAKNLYTTCLNEDLVNTRGTEPIYPLLKEIRGLLPTTTAEDERPSGSRRLTEALSFMHKRQIGNPFTLKVEADPKDPSINVIILNQAGLSLPSREYYDQEESVQLLHNAIVETLNIVHSKESKESKEGDKFDVESTARLIVDFEKKIAEKSEFYEYFQNPERTYHLHSLSELSKIALIIDWELYVDLLTPTHLARPKTIIIKSPNYVANISHLFEQESTRTLQAYLTWQAIFAYANALGEEIRAPIRSFNSKLTGVDPKSVKFRWETCLDEINYSLGLLAGRYYVIEYFSANTKKQADDFFDSIKDVFIKRLPELTWIDDATREKALKKVNTLNRKIGYPDTSPNVLSPTSMSEYYKDLSVNDEYYFENYLNVRRFAISKVWKTVGQTPDPDRWELYPHEVDAFYNSHVNDINFPAGILQNPFFGNNYPEYLNYGGIGAVVGHELTHGFDNHGRHYDASGRLIEWWSNDTNAKFEEKAQCFIDQYSNFTIIGDKGEPLRVNGKLTLNENLADNGGLSEAYSAWKQRSESDKESKIFNNVRLPGLENYTLDQLFFVNFGRIWCTSLTLAQYKKMILTNEHSPGRWHVNGVIQNSRKFTETFKCPAGSPMNPVKKCELW